MSEVCPHCGHKRAERPKERSEFKWSCFARGFCKDDGAQDEQLVVETNTGLYQRRKTIHFDTDIIVAAKRKSLRNQASILRQPERSPQDLIYRHLLSAQIAPPKVLLVFNDQDPVSAVFAKAAEKLGFEINEADSEDLALEQYFLKYHELVIIDSRIPKIIDFNTLIRSIRNSRGSQHSTFTAIVKKSTFDKDELGILSLLDTGFNKCIVENTSFISVYNEMVQLKHSYMLLKSQHATCQSVYAALDKCKDIVIITDDGYKCQYVNTAFERTLNIRHDDMVGKTLQEQLLFENLQLTTLGSFLHRGREWKGPLTLKKNHQDIFLAACRAIPVSCHGRTPSHYVLVLDMNHSFDVTGQQRGSLHSIRKGSSDGRSVGSDFYRRISLAKLSQLPLEAPITKIAGLIEQARETSVNHPQVIQFLDQITEVLRTPELYAAQVKEDRRDEPIVSELISALLSRQSHPSVSLSSRRSSNDSSLYRPSRGGTIKVPADLKEVLDEVLTWEFDIFRLEKLTKRRPLQYLGMKLFTHFDVGNTLNCDEKTLYHWLIIIEANYHSDNSYHNSTHASDVMQAIAGFLEREKLKALMESLDEATSLIAAAAHDLDHPGKSNAFLANSDNPLTILYNDTTVLESHHAALMFKLTLGDDRVNIFKNLDKETYKVARHNVIDMILATEMTKHFEHLTKFVNVFCSKSTTGDIEIETDFLSVTPQENNTLIKRMMIKCADVSNPTRPLRLCVEWARRIAEEYFQQTDDEKERGLPVVMPMFDRHTCSIPKSQIGFIDFIINDMFEAWNAYIDMPELLIYMRQNYIKWREFDEQGLSTLADITKLQNNVLSSAYAIKSVQSESIG